MKKFLKKMVKYVDEETIHLEATCSTIIQRILPQKANGIGGVTFPPVTIRNASIGKVLIHLGANINLIHLSLIKKIGDLEMK